MSSGIDIVVGGLIGFFSAVFSTPLQAFLFRPRLRVTFTGADDCVSPTDEGVPDGENRAIVRYREAIYLRVRVENRSKRVAKACLAYLVKVERDDGNGSFEPTIYSDSIPLAWSCRGPAAYSETDIPYGIAQYVDVLKTHSDQDHVVPQWLFGPHRYLTLLDSEGKYRLTVQVSGEGVTPATVKVIFDWKGKWDTFEAHRA